MKKKVNRAGRAFTVKHPGKYRALQKRYKALLEENESLLGGKWYTLCRECLTKIYSLL